MSEDLSDSIHEFPEADVSALARAAGVEVPADDMLEVRLRLSVLLDAMNRVDDENTDDADPDPLGRA
jgi:hypothetical protein